MPASAASIHARGDDRRGVARILVLVWAAFWLFFNLASAIGEALEVGPAALVGHLVTAVAILAVAVLVWWRERLGALALVGFGVAAQLVFSPSPLVGVLFTLPPVVAGGLLLWPRGPRDRAPSGAGLRPPPVAGR